MERELFRRLYERAYHLGKTRRVKHVVHPDWKIVVVYLWAVLHDRPTAWACDPRNWPAAARVLTLPDPSTISRRLRRPSIVALISDIERSLLRRVSMPRIGFIDAKPLPVGGCSRDPDVGFGRGAGMMAKGYKLHVICDEHRLPIAWTIRPMNEHDSTVAHQLIARLSGSGVIVGDNAYDMNRLYDDAGARGWQLVAPRHAGTALGHKRHSPWRVRAHRAMPSEEREALLAARDEVERFFACLGNNGFGLGPLPNWVRRLHRVTLWVAAKMLLYIAYRLSDQARAA